MNYRRANADELVLDDRNRYHKLCEELDYVMSLNSKYVEVLIGDEYKNIHSAGNALRGGRLGHPAITPSAFTNVTTN